MIYLLNGWGDTDRTWIDESWVNVPQILDQYFAGETHREMIVVIPSGFTKFGSTFYTNSIATGNWEDFISYDLVAYIDSQYRTIATPASHAIAGHSSGGYGAVKLAMKHPDIFGVTYGMSACCLGWSLEDSPKDPNWENMLKLNSIESVASTVRRVQAVFQSERAGHPGPASDKAYQLFLACCLLHRRHRGRQIRTACPYFLICLCSCETELLDWIQL